MGDLETGVRDARDFSQELPNSPLRRINRVYFLFGLDSPGLRLESVQGYWRTPPDVTGAGCA